MHGQGNYAPYFGPGGTPTPLQLFQQGISGVPQPPAAHQGPPHFSNLAHQTDIPTQPQQPHLAPLATNMPQAYLNSPQPPYGNPPNVPTYHHSGPLYNQPMHGQTFHHMRQPAPMPPIVLQTPPPPPPMQGHILFRTPPPPPSGVQHLPIPPPLPSSSFVSMTPVPFAPFRQNDPIPSPPPPSLPPSPPPLPPFSPPPASPMLHVPDATRECLRIVTSMEFSNEKLAAEVERGQSCSKDSLVEGKASSSPPPRPDEEVVKDIEVLCQSIAKVGPSFVNDTRGREANNPRFSFLFGGEPGSAAALGHAYFQWMERKALLDKDNLVKDVPTSSVSGLGMVMEGGKTEEASNVYVKDGNSFKLIEDYSSDKEDDLGDELHHSPSMSPISGHSFPIVSPNSSLPTDNSIGSINIVKDNVNCDKNKLDSRADRNLANGDINASDFPVEKMQSDEPLVQKNTLDETDEPGRLVRDGESVSHESSSLNQGNLPSQSQPLMNQSTQYMPSMDGNLPSSVFPGTNSDHPHHPLPHHQHPPGSFTYPSNVDLNRHRYPYKFPERNLPHDVLIPRVTPHYNPYASTFENPLPSFSLGGGTGLRMSASPFKSRPLMDDKLLLREGVQMLNATTSRDSITRLHTRNASAEVPSQKQATRDAAHGEPYDPLLDSIDPSPSVFNKFNHVQNLENDRVTMSKHVRPPDIKENNGHKWDTIAAKSDDDEYGELAMDAEVGAVENASPGLVDAKGWDPDIPNSSNAAAGEIEVAQVQSQSKSKKNKDSRSMKLFKTALADFVKEVLKPTWRQGTMSKEEFKTIVKKTVDKVSGAMPSHNIPKSQEKIDQYVRSSERKLTNLVMGYVDKYVKL